MFRRTNTKEKIVFSNSSFISLENKIDQFLSNINYINLKDVEEVELKNCQTRSWFTKVTIPISQVTIKNKNYVLKFEIDILKNFQERPKTKNFIIIPTRFTSKQQKEIKELFLSVLNNLKIN
jgi:hypothetical protein